MWERYRSSKYGAQKTNGYASKREAQYAQELEYRKKSKEIVGYESQVRIPLFGENGAKICTYIIDFVVLHSDGIIEYVEVKGFETVVWKLKWKLFVDKYGKDTNKKLTIVR